MELPSIEQQADLPVKPDQVTYTQKIRTHFSPLSYSPFRFKNGETGIHRYTYAMH